MTAQSPAGKVGEAGFTPAKAPVPTACAGQVAAQCRVVAHLARAIATVYADKALLFEAGDAPSILAMNDAASYDLMQTLGDVLNGMDAVTDEDDWVAPVFAAAHAARGLFRPVSQ